MRPIPARRANTYTGSPLDRVSNQRDDEAFVSSALAGDDAVFVPVWRARSLMRNVAEGKPEAVFITKAEADASRDGHDWALLPEHLGVLTDIRSTAGLLQREDAAILAHARGLMHWRTRHRFCGVCGGACRPRSAGNAMACSVCNTQHFPRTDPAVIMLVTHGDQALLGHSTRFPNSNMYSTLAGFVEPGESLEEAVAREVFEESGIRVGGVFYHSSQPWPFPSSIMLGFHAEALSHEITIDPQEIEDARWFTRAQLRAPESVGISLPRADSIARRLIEDWMEAA